MVTLEIEVSNGTTLCSTPDEHGIGRRRRLGKDKTWGKFGLSEDSEDHIPGFFIKVNKDIHNGNL